MANLTAEQLAAMFSKEEISRGISSSDISLRLKEFGIKRERRLTPQQEFKQSDVLVIPERRQRIEMSQSVRDKILPPTMKEITKEGKIITVRKRKFGPLNPELEASEAQKEALLKITGKSQSQTTRGEASEQFNVLNRQRSMDLVSAIQGGHSTDPEVQRLVGGLTPEQRAQANEILFRIANKKAVSSPLMLPFRDVKNVLKMVK